MAEANDSPRTTAGSQRSPLDPELAAVLGIYLGELLEGKRVAVLGDGSSPLGDQLAESTGRRVHVFDPDARRTAAAIAASRGGPAVRSGTEVRHALLESDAELGLASFDIVLVPDLADLAESGAIDAKGALALAERMLAPRGFVAVAAPRGASKVDYVTLFELVSDRFAFVKMLGAAPFVGVTVAEFGGDDEPAVGLDSSRLSSSEEPLAYLAIGSRHAVPLDPYLVVQLPWDEVLGTEGPPTLPRRKLEAAAQREALAAAEARAKEATKDAEEQRRRLATQATRLAEAEAQLADERRKRREDAAESERGRKRAAEEQQRELDAMLERIAELEADLEAPRTQPRPTIESEGPPTQPRPNAEGEDAQPSKALEFQLGELRKALDEARSEADALRAEAARAKTLEAERQALATQLAKARAALEAARSDEAASEAAREVDRLESRLRERGERIATLEAELREAERTGRELVREVVARSQGPAAGARPLGVDAAVPAAAAAVLAARCSELEAELEAARWTGAALERELGERASSGEDVARLEAALRRAEDALHAGAIAARFETTS
ncbi:MAG: hypothetical protein FJ096_19365 [Deltaproteobacteria bacterium]|nr:hypothetical protein [Deltaproteobacteria bacterium]